MLTPSQRRVRTWARLARGSLFMPRVYEIPCLPASMTFHFMQKKSADREARRVSLRHKFAGEARLGLHDVDFYGNIIPSASARRLGRIPASRLGNAADVAHL